MQKRIIFRLPDDMSQAVHQLVESGQYKTLSDVVRDALTRLLNENAAE
jgi:Arc/MetJ-type ribon-helix-helix transcriptional regulator